MSCAVIPPPNPLSMNPIVVACTAPVPIPIPIAISASASSSPAPVPVTARPAFDWRNTTDRLREGLHRQLPFENDDKARQHRRSIFLEMGLHGDEMEEKGDLPEQAEGEADVMGDDDGDDEILPRTRRPRPASGIFLSNFLRLGLGDDDSGNYNNDSTSAAASQVTNIRKRFSWSPATSFSMGEALSPVSTTAGLSVSRTWSSTAMTTTTATTMSTVATGGSPDRKRPWYAKLGGGGGRRRLRNRSLTSFAKE